MGFRQLHKPLRLVDGQVQIPAPKARVKLQFLADCLKPYVRLGLLHFAQSGRHPDRGPFSAKGAEGTLLWGVDGAGPYGPFRQRPSVGNMEKQSAPACAKRENQSPSMTLKSMRVNQSAIRRCLPLRDSASKQLTRSTLLKKRPRAPSRMRARRRWRDAFCRFPVSHRYGRAAFLSVATSRWGRDAPLVMGACDRGRGSFRSNASPACCRTFSYVPCKIGHCCHIHAHRMDGASHLQRSSTSSSLWSVRTMSHLPLQDQRGFTPCVHLSMKTDR